MTTVKKEQTVSELAGLLKKSSMIVLTDYRGMKVSELSDVRRQMRTKGMEYHVAKNTLTVLAAQEAGIEMTPQLREQLNGPIALVFAGDDIAANAKLLNDYLRTARVMKVKNVVLEGKLLTPNSLDDLAKLPSKQQLYGQVAGTLISPISNLASVLNASIRNLANVLQQRVDQLGSPSDGAGSAEATPSPAPVEAQAEAVSATAEQAAEETTPEAAPAGEVAPDEAPAS